VCTFCSTHIDTWAKGKSSNILPRYYREGRYRQFFLILLREKRPGVLPLTRNKATECSEWVGKTFPRPKEFQKSHIKIRFVIFFDSQDMMQKEFIPQGKTVKADFYKGVMDRFLKCIQRVGPAGFCSRDFFLLNDNASVQKAASVC